MSTTDTPTLTDAVVVAVATELTESAAATENPPAITNMLLAGINAQLEAGAMVPLFDGIPVEENQIQFFDLGGIVLIVVPPTSDDPERFDSWQANIDFAPPLYGKIRDVVVEACNDFAPKPELTGSMLTSVRLVLEGLATFDVDGTTMKATDVPTGTYRVGEAIGGTLALHAVENDRYSTSDIS